MSLSLTPEVLRYAAFTDDPAGGNPAGVVLGAGTLSDVEMQRIAAEVGYSETAFVTGEGEARGVRFFSPRAEVPFCGHATIATAVALAERERASGYVFQTQVGDVPVSVGERDGRVVATLTSVETWSRPPTDAEREPALRALRLGPSDLAASLPVHLSFAGNKHFIVPVASREVLAALSYDYDALLAHMDAEQWTTVHVTWRESDGLWHARDPFPVGGVVEDAATGAAAAAFGGYVRALELVPLPVSITIIQGEDMGRRSVLTLDLSDADGRSRVSGGAVELVGEAEREPATSQ